MKSLDFEPNVEMKAAIEGYFRLWGAAEKQWNALESNMSHYLEKIAGKVSEHEQQVRELQRQIATLESTKKQTKVTLRTTSGGTETSPAKLPQNPCVSVAPPAGSRPAMPPPRIPVLPIGHSKEHRRHPVSDCPFSAGPAPRSARSARSSRGETKAKDSQSPFAGFRAALTPRFLLSRQPNEGQRC